jgi:hypothetical protein
LLDHKTLEWDIRRLIHNNKDWGHYSQRLTDKEPNSS